MESQIDWRRENDEGSKGDRGGWRHRSFLKQRVQDQSREMMTQWQPGIKLTGQGQKVQCLELTSFHDSLSRETSGKKCATVLQWMPAQCGVAGNEQSDRLAKEGGRPAQHMPSLSR